MTRNRASGQFGRRAHQLTATIALVATAFVAVLTGCASNTQNGMLVGGAGGAAACAASGSSAGHAGSGAVIGGSLGLMGGGLVGDSADQADRHKQQ
jgi:hypothetical protein